MARWRVQNLGHLGRQAKSRTRKVASPSTSNRFALFDPFQLGTKSTAPLKGQGRRARSDGGCFPGDDRDRSRRRNGVLEHLRVTLGRLDGEGRLDGVAEPDAQAPPASPGSGVVAGRQAGDLRPLDDRVGSGIRPSGHRLQLLAQVRTARRLLPLALCRVVSELTALPQQPCRSASSRDLRRTLL